MRIILLTIAISIFPLSLAATDNEQTQSIKSLSAQDIAELRRGGGWGLAKAAELNGLPGARHLLDLKDDIPMDSMQVIAISDIFEDMKARAIEQGEQLIALELALEELFQGGSVEENDLRVALTKIAAARGKLRYIHLAAHLQTANLLSKAQINRYNILRGYRNPDPCAQIPEGHNAANWRRHNGCN